MLAIVLSGGGAKGAYQAGVWKALKQLKIKYDIVTGTSIGAINGMMMAQKSYYRCMKLWKNISFEQLYDDFKYTENKKEIFKNYVDKVINGGIDTSKIEKLINNNYKSNKLYNSGISYGVTSFNLSNRKVFYATNKNTRPGMLKKYILASATCFPVFKPTKIGIDTYIDGSYSDYIPINLAIEMGADEIIAVDLGAMGIKKRIKYKDVNVTYIKPRKKLDSFFMFERNAARRMLNIGYNDTMKTFGKLDGDIYTFRKGTFSIINKYKSKMIELSDNYDDDMSKKINKNIFTIIEDELETLELPVDKIYTISSCNNEVIKILDNVDDINLNELSLEEIKKIFDKKSIIKYFYTSLKKHDKINNILLNIFGKEFVFAVYLKVLGE